MNKLDNPVLQVLEDYQAAVWAKDVDSFVALYDREAVVFDMWGSWSYHGIASWRAMVEGWFGSLGAERVNVNFSAAQTIVAADLAVVHAFATYKAVDADGLELRSMDNRLTMTLRLQADGWKIVHQHTSAPIEVGTAQVIFRR
ncbi:MULTISPECIES: YybH family protein [Paraburkholderia]|uniref:Nuclear transport factor 2 family protein n=1 Tax=Paraburkholderia podalyriae TaxID=1938811 RepID=A0ABR7PH38_9BURK|nr:nuclear transport factor 2 family protein [Paraburkholderia podalyriae]MBC8745634.1 nuclear transport factor 2 family protein [Paraburkholderia podalyriae]